MVIQTSPRPPVRHSARRGSALLEAVVAMAIGAVMAGAAIVEARSALTASRVARQREEALTTAHDVIATAVGAPCGPPLRCPVNLRCDLRRSPLGVIAGVPLFRVAVRVRSADPSGGVLATLSAIGRADCP